MKNSIPFLTFLFMLLSQCTGGGSGSASAPASQAPASQPPESQAPAEYEPAPAAEYNLFYEMPSSFYFSSGVGGWGTSLEIEPDGSFYGSYHDSDMGDTGDGYPNGTVYFCDFRGQFSMPEELDDYTWVMYMQYLDYDPPGAPYIDGGTRWIPSGPYGLESAYEILIYKPGTPVYNVPEGFMVWDYVDYNAPALTNWGLYNTSEQLGFVG